MALSQDLRCRIVDLVKSGTSRRQAARHFQVSVSSAIRFARQAKERPKQEKFSVRYQETLTGVSR